MKRGVKTLIAGVYFAVISVITATAALADNDIDIIGQVKVITPRSIKVDSIGIEYTVIITPITDITAEYKSGPFEYHRRIPLSDIKIGEWIKIDAVKQGEAPNFTYIADEMEVSRF